MSTDAMSTTEAATPTWTVKQLHAVDDAQLESLTDVLIDCVEGGASVSFMLPLTRERAMTFWRGVARDVAAGKRVLLVAEDEQGICGTVQLLFDLPENQPHRADVAKMLVRRRARRQGLGAALMKAAENTARAHGKTLLVLDTVTGSDASRLYERLGWLRAGDVPNYALWPGGGFCGTTFYYRDLEPTPLSPSSTHIPVADSEIAVAVDIHIRLANEADLPAIVDIYNQSIPAGWSTADTRPIAVADRVDWFRKFDATKRPIWVAEFEGRVIATVYVSSFYGGRPAYDATAEISVYIATAYHRRGIGRRLNQWVIEQCPRLGITTLLSMHFDHNQGTRRINESLGFERLGHLTEIANVHGQQRGLVMWALRIPPAEIRESRRAPMLEITAQIEWHRHEANFCDNRYSRRHSWRFDGGAEVPASSSPHIVPVPMSDAAAVDPEEAYVAAAASCHMLWFLSIAAREGFVVDRYTDNPVAQMRKNSDKKLVIDVVTLHPRIHWSGDRQPTDAQVLSMHEKAHAECFIANSIKSRVHIQPVA